MIALNFLFIDDTLRVKNEKSSSRRERGQEYLKPN
jgi:hypothetical protein